AQLGRGLVLEGGVALACGLPSRAGALGRRIVRLDARRGRADGPGHEAVSVASASRRSVGGGGGFRGGGAHQRLAAGGGSCRRPPRDRRGAALASALAAG